MLKVFLQTLTNSRSWRPLLASQWRLIQPCFQIADLLCKWFATRLNPMLIIFRMSQIFGVNYTALLIKMNNKFIVILILIYSSSPKVTSYWLIIGSKKKRFFKKRKFVCECFLKKVKLTSKAALIHVSSCRKMTWMNFSFSVFYHLVNLLIRLYFYSKLN